MYSRIETLPEKKLLGMRMKMSFAENKTHELWKGFMVRRKDIRNNLTNDLFSMQLYGACFDFKNFDPHKIFEKWAAVEVADLGTIPDQMEGFVLKGGQYAVFQHIGPAS